MRNEKFWVIFLTLLFTLSAHAEPKCASYLGLCSPHWNCDHSLTVFRRLPVKCTGYLAETFNKEGCPCANKFLALPGPKILRVHLTNGTCFPERGRRCGSHEVFAGESIASADRKLKRGDKRLLRRYRRSIERTRTTLHNLDANTQLYISPCLESPFSDAARKVMADIAREAFPLASVVDSVIRQKCLPGLVCETHGEMNKGPANHRITAPCIRDSDGEDFLGIPDYHHPQCIGTFLWEPEFNCLDTSRQGFQPPLQRTHCASRYGFQLLRDRLR